MARVIRSVPELLKTPDGSVYTVSVCGRQRIDGLWEGWIEFAPRGALPVLRTPRETTQPNLIDLEYWARGLTPVYLEGALNRAIAAHARVRIRRSRRPLVSTYEGPAPDAATHTAATEPVETASESGTAEAVLDPFSWYRKGEDVLRRQLGALHARHLRDIVRAYGLASVREIDVQALDDSELVELIVAGVRGTLVA